MGWRGQKTACVRNIILVSGLGWMNLGILAWVRLQGPGCLGKAARRRFYFAADRTVGATDLNGTYRTYRTDAIPRKVGET